MVKWKSVIVPAAIAAIIIWWFGYKGTEKRLTASSNNLIATNTTTKAIAPNVIGNLTNVQNSQSTPALGKRTTVKKKKRVFRMTTTTSFGFDKPKPALRNPAHASVTPESSASTESLEITASVSIDPNLTLAQTEGSSLNPDQTKLARTKTKANASLPSKPLNLLRTNQNFLSDELDDDIDLPKPIKSGALSSTTITSPTSTSSSLGTKEPDFEFEDETNVKINVFKKNLTVQTPEPTKFENLTATTSPTVTLKVQSFETDSAIPITTTSSSASKLEIPISSTQTAAPSTDPKSIAGTLTTPISMPTKPVQLSQNVTSPAQPSSTPQTVPFPVSVIVPVLIQNQTKPSLSSTKAIPLHQYEYTSGSITQLPSTKTRNSTVQATTPVPVETASTALTRSQTEPAPVTTTTIKPSWEESSENILEKHIKVNLNSGDNLIDILKEDFSDESSNQTQKQTVSLETVDSTTQTSSILSSTSDKPESVNKTNPRIPKLSIVSTESTHKSPDLIPTEQNSTTFQPVPVSVQTSFSLTQNLTKSNLVTLPVYQTAKSTIYPESTTEQKPITTTNESYNRIGYNSENELEIDDLNQNQSDQDTTTGKVPNQTEADILNADPDLSPNQNETNEPVYTQTEANTSLSSVTLPNEEIELISKSKAPENTTIPVQIKYLPESTTQTTPSSTPVFLNKEILKNAEADAQQSVLSTDTNSKSNYSKINYSDLDNQHLSPTTVNTSLTTDIPPSIEDKLVVISSTVSVLKGSTIFLEHLPVSQTADQVKWDSANDTSTPGTLNSSQSTVPASLNSELSQNAIKVEVIEAPKKSFTPIRQNLAKTGFTTTKIPTTLAVQNTTSESTLETETANQNISPHTPAPETDPTQESTQRNEFKNKFNKQSSLSELEPKEEVTPDSKKHLKKAKYNSDSVYEF